MRVVIVASSIVGCSAAQLEPAATADSPSSPAASAQSVIRVTGSDTMVNLVQAWAERYRVVRPEVAVQVAGGGSGVGIASLADGLAEIAAASREITADERARIGRNGAVVVEWPVALDALAVYVRRDNPLDAIALDDLAEIYGDGGGIVTWSQLSAANSACRRDVIVRVGRQNSSGTYAYFREAVLGHTREYKLGSIDQSGSKDVVALVSRTPCAIGYSGMAFANPEVKQLRVARHREAPAVPPTPLTAFEGSYPLARRLYLYTRGQPTGPARAFLEWILGSAGQQIVREIGYVTIGGESPPS